MFYFLTSLTFFAVLFVASQASAAERATTQYDVSILLEARVVDGFGDLPHLDFNFSEIDHLPIFSQKPNSRQSVIVEGLVSDRSKVAILKTFEDLPGDEPLSFPTKAIVLGLRLDPCSNSHLGVDAQCTPQLRLVAEEPDLKDRSVHVIYNFAEPDFQKLLKDLKSLNDRCDSLEGNMDLAVHPCSKDAEFLSRLNNLVVEHATNERLKKVAFQIRTSDNPLRVLWTFAAAELNAGKWELIKTSFAPQGEEFFAFGVGGGEFSGVILNDLDRKVVEGLQRKLSEPETTNLVSLLEDTSQARVDNTSCMSCHASPALRSRFDSLKAVTPSYFVISDQERESSFSPGSADIRHFGYRFGLPKISNRVLIETQQTVKLLNRE